MLHRKDSSSNKEAHIYSPYKTNTFPRGWKPGFGNIKLFLSVCFSPWHLLMYFPEDRMREKHGIFSNLKCYSQLCFSGPVGLVSETHMILTDRLVSLHTATKKENKQTRTQNKHRHSTTPLDSDLSNKWAKLKTSLL